MDEKITQLCLEVSNYLFNNKDKYNPHTKVIITNSNIEIVQGVQGIPIER